MRNTKFTDEFMKCHKELEPLERRRLKLYQDWNNTNSEVRKLISNINNSMLKKLTSTNINTEIKFRADEKNEDSRYYDYSKEELILSNSGFRYKNPSYRYRQNSRELPNEYLIKILSDKNTLEQIKNILVKENKKYSPSIVEDLIKVSDNIKELIGFGEEEQDLYKFTDKKIVVRDFQLENNVGDHSENVEEPDSLCFISAEYHKEASENTSRRNGYNGNKMLVHSNYMEINGIAIRPDRFQNVMSLYEIKDEVTELFDEIEPKIKIKLSKINSVIEKVKEELSVRFALTEINKESGGN